MRTSTRILAAWVVASALASPGFAHADDQAELEKARVAYVAKSYAVAEERLRALVDPKTGPKDAQLVAQARMYLGALHVAAKRREEAAAAFEQLLLEAPQFEPDPLSFPTDVLNAFIDTRATLRERLSAAAQAAAKAEAERRAREEAERVRHAEYVRRLEDLAREDKTTVRNSRLVAAIPFGVGQFQNGQRTLGWTLLGLEAALVAASVITVPIYTTAISRRNEEHALGDPEKKAQAYADRATAAYATNLAVLGAFVAVAGAGIVQAQLGFVESTTEQRTRPLPAQRRAPSVTVGWGTLGVEGRF